MNKLLPSADDLTNALQKITQARKKLAECQRIRLFSESPHKLNTYNNCMLECEKIFDEIEPTNPILKQ